MGYFGQIFMLSGLLTGALIFAANVLYGIRSGRLKTDPNSEWVTFRQHRTKFLRIFVGYVIFAVFFALGAVKVFVDLLD